MTEWIHSGQQPMLEAEAHALVEDPRVVAAKEQAVHTLRDSGLATDDATREQLVPYIDGLGFIQALRVLNHWAEPPICASTPYPAGRSGMDNPDAFYRSIAVNESSSYLIKGKRNSSTCLYFQILDAQPGDDTLATSHGFLSSAMLKTEDDGYFEITLSPSPHADGAANHMQLQPGSKLVLIRDNVSDWRREMPAEMSVERIEGPAIAPAEDPAAEVARRVISQSTFWLEYTKQLLAIPENSLTNPAVAVGGLPGQVNSLGRFSVEPDEALVITFDRLKWPYFSIHLGTNWFRSVAYWDNTSSLNTAQAVPNKDGSATYVIANEDPGVANWLDPAGTQTGLVLARWQDLPESMVPSPPTVKLTSLAGLSALLDDAVPRVSAAERAEQLLARRAAFDLRGFPPAP